MPTTTEKSEPVKFSAHRHALTHQRVDLELPEGLSLSEMMAHAGLDPRMAPWYRVCVDGQEVLPQWWDRTRPKAGHQVTLGIVPMSSGGGSKGSEDKNKTLRTVLLILVVIVAAVATWYIGGVGGALVGAAIGAIGSMAIWALLPPTKPRRPDEDSAAFSPSIAGGRNQIRPWGVVPRLLGRHRVYPPGDTR